MISSVRPTIIKFDAIDGTVFECDAKDVPEKGRFSEGDWRGIQEQK
jgi:hypothetical protein